MRKAVITGMGCVSGLGLDRHTTWKALAGGQSALKPFHKSCENNPALSVDAIAAPMADGLSDRLIETFGEKQVTSVDNFTNYALAATLEALEDAGLKGDTARLNRAAIVYGSAMGGLATIEAGYQRLLDAKLTTVHPMSIPRGMPNASVSHLSMLFGVRGHCLALSSACASSAHAVAEAMYLIRSHRADVVITGGSDASLTFGSLSSWKALQAMAPDTCRPFSIDRKGMVLGEGGATLIVEEEEHAKKRGATIYAELGGAASSADARHITQPDYANAAATIRAAHQDAGLADDIPLLISTHGTGTKLNDKSEAQALKLAYSSNLAKHTIIATKSSHGHMLGATGAMEFLVAIMALKEKVAPPILNYLGPDPDCDIPLVLESQAMTCEAVVSNSFAFGGLNSVLIARRY